MACYGEDCKKELAQVPTLSGCPSDDEFFFVCNAADGFGKFGYGKRQWSDLKACIAMGNTISFKFLEIIVGTTRDGDGNIILNDTDVQLVIPVVNPIQDSLFITFGTEMPREQDGVASAYYGEVYNSDNITVNFIQNFSNGDLIICHYAYLT